MRLYEMHMRDKFSLTHLLFITSTLVLLVAPVVTKSANADAYLDALQQESDDLQYLEGGKKKPADNPNKKEMDIDSFEKFLAEKDVALFSVYRKLETAKRLRVLRTYNITRDYKKAEQMIHELHISGK